MRRRLLAIAVTGVVLYGLAPALAQVFGAYKHLGSISLAWWVGVLVTQLGALAAMIDLQRVALSTRRWVPVATSNLASSALAKVVPGGSATAAAVQSVMLVRAGFSAPAIATGLAAGGVLVLAALCALPLLCLPALAAGDVPRRLVSVALLGLALFVVLFAISLVFLTVTPAVRAIGRATVWGLNRIHRAGPDTDGLPERLVAQRDVMRHTLGRHWYEAAAVAVARWLLDFLCLLSALLAVGAHPPLALALLAYVAAQLLSQIPVTPGGLGVVEAGLTGTLALAGVGVAPAAVATLAYRLASYWLPLPLGLGAWVIHRRRYGGSDDDVESAVAHDAAKADV